MALSQSVRDLAHKNEYRSLEKQRFAPPNFFEAKREFFLETIKNVKNSHAIEIRSYEYVYLS